MGGGVSRPHSVLRNALAIDVEGVELTEMKTGMCQGMLWPLLRRDMLCVYTEVSSILSFKNDRGL